VKAAPRQRAVKAAPRQLAVKAAPYRRPSTTYTSVSSLRNKKNCK
jgi:hypothetical protein